MFVGFFRVVLLTNNLFIFVDVESSTVLLHHNLPTVDGHGGGFFPGGALLCDVACLLYTGLRCVCVCVYGSVGYISQSALLCVCLCMFIFCRY